MTDLDFDPNFILRIFSLQTSHSVDGGPNKRPKLGYNPGIVTFKGDGSLQILSKNSPFVIGFAAAAAAAAADPSSSEPPPEIEKALPASWQIGFYQVLFSLKREIFRQSEEEGMMASLARGVNAGSQAHRKGYKFDRAVVEVTEPCRDASDSYEENFAPWYDSNGSLLTGLKSTYKSIGRQITFSPCNFSLSMSDAPGIVPQLTSSRSRNRVIGMRQEASFGTFLLMINTDTDKRDKVFVLSSWSWTANFIYLEPGNTAPITRGGITVTAHDQTPRFIQSMPYPDIKDRPVGKEVLKTMGEPKIFPVPDLNLYLVL